MAFGIHPPLFDLLYEKFEGFDYFFLINIKLFIYMIKTLLLFCFFCNCSKEIFFLFIFILLTRFFIAGPKDVKDIYYVLKDNAAQLIEGNDTISPQVNASTVYDVEAFKAFFLPCLLNLNCVNF